MLPTAQRANRIYGFPQGGKKLSAKRTDEGLLCRHNLLVDNIRKATPHPAFGRLPPQGKAFLLLTPLL